MSVPNKIPLAWMLAALAATAALPGTAEASAGTPRIRARPRSVMVTTDTTLVGHGFPADSAISLRECGRTFWLAPEEPCDSDNEVAVMTDARGRFATPFKADVCPEGEPGRVITERTCYIGVPQAGEDTGGLLYPVRIKVTYP
jgi:hypothetical protein